jgi:hypothetical protein
MKNFAYFWSFVRVLGFAWCACAAVMADAADDDDADPDLALQPATVLVEPWRQHLSPTKRQGVPGITITRGGRMWAIYGRDVEGPRNYQVLRSSDSKGKRWSDPHLMIFPTRGVRAMSATVWTDPHGRLWVFWGQSFGMQDGRYGIWCVVSDNPEADRPDWSAPRRIGDGIMLNKPTVLSDGDWLLTSSVWKSDHSIKVYETTDEGESFRLRSTAHIADPETRGPDEPMIVERNDGSLWMMVRCRGIAETVSTDRGKTWSPVERLEGIRHPTARFFLRRLKSGALLLVKHGPIDERTRREQLMAFVSDDDGASWQGGLMLDEREDVTYPDGIEDEHGTISIIYDHQRTPLGEVLMARFTEDDIRAGKAVSDKVELRMPVVALPVE